MSKIKYTLTLFPILSFFSFIFIKNEQVDRFPLALHYNSKEIDENLNQIAKIEMNWKLVNQSQYENANFEVVTMSSEHDNSLIEPKSIKNINLSHFDLNLENENDLLLYLQSFPKLDHNDLQSLILLYSKTNNTALKASIVANIGSLIFNPQAREFLNSLLIHPDVSEEEKMQSIYALNAQISNFGDIAMSLYSVVNSNSISENLKPHIIEALASFELKRNSVDINKSEDEIRHLLPKLKHNISNPDVLKTALKMLNMDDELPLQGGDGNSINDREIMSLKKKKNSKPKSS